MPPIVAMGQPHRITVAGLALAAFGSALLTGTAASAAPTGPPTPTPASVSQQLRVLAVRNVALVEQINRAQIDVAATQTAQRAAAAVVRSTQAALDQADVMFAAAATTEYEAGSFTGIGALLTSDSGQGYLDRLQTLQTMSSHTAQVITDVSLATSRARAAQQRASALVAAAAARSEALVKQIAEVRNQVGIYTTMLAGLTVVQRTALQQSMTPAVSDGRAAASIAELSATRASTRAVKAVQFALAQVGKPYVMNTAGPATYDCSGLTMASWASAGVTLPHSSELQFTLGVPVSVSELLPGDLLFFYGPSPGHVTIYLGGGLMVTAPEPGENVKIANLSGMIGDYVGARRVG